MARTLGLDIGKDVVRGVVLTTTLRNTVVSEYVEVTFSPHFPSPKDVTHDDSQSSDVPEDVAAGSESPLPEHLESLRGAIRVLLRKLEKQPDTVVVAIQGDAVSLRIVELPKAAAKRIADVLPFEMEALLPFAVEDAVIDYQPVPVAPGVQTLPFLSAAVPRARVAAHLAELRSVGVDPKLLMVAPVALEGLGSVLTNETATSPIVVVDLGQQRTDICFVSSGHCIAARTLSIGISDLPKGASELAQALKQSMASYRAQSGAAPVKVLLTGEGATAEGAVKWVEEQWDIPTEVPILPEARLCQAVTDTTSMTAEPMSDTRPSISIRVPALSDVQSQVISPSPVFARALALAARGAARGKHIDLRQGEFASGRTAGALRKEAKLVAISATVVVTMMAFSLHAKWSLLTEQRDGLQAKLTRVSREVLGREIHDPAEVDELLGNGDSAQDPLPRFDVVDVLDALSAAVPNDVVHDTDKLIVNLGEQGREGHFELEGSVASIGQRDQIAAELEKHRCFHNLEKGRTSSAISEERINYQIEAVVNCSPGQGKKREGTNTDR